MPSLNQERKEWGYMKKISKHLILGVAFLLLSFAITIQLRVAENSDSVASKDKIYSGLKDEIFDLNNDNEKMQKRLETIEKQLEVVRKQAAENDTSNLDKSNLIKKYAIIEGKTDVTGQGIVIRYYPNEYRSSGDMVNNADITKDLVDIVNELKNAGAEAIAVNDIRVTNNSSIEMVKNSIIIDGEKIAKPFIVKSIGNSETMNSSLIRPGGTIELIKNDRARVELAISREVSISRTSNIQ